MCQDLASNSILPFRLLLCVSSNLSFTSNKITRSGPNSYFHNSQNNCTCTKGEILTLCKLWKKMWPEEKKNEAKQKQLALLDKLCYMLSRLIFKMRWIVPDFWVCFQYHWLYIKVPGSAWYLSQLSHHQKEVRNSWDAMYSRQGDIILCEHEITYVCSFYLVVLTLWSFCCCFFAYAQQLRSLFII